MNKMAANEHMVFQFTHRPPLYPRLATRARVYVKSPELWGEQEPRLGAWSPSPRIPAYEAHLLDHNSGAYTVDTCGPITFGTRAHPSSCSTWGRERSEPPPTRPPPPPRPSQPRDRPNPATFSPNRTVYA